MSNTVPLNIEMQALPPAVRWTPQQLGDAIAARLRITTQQTLALFVSGSTEPSSNVGPWLKNGTEWWVWSDSDGAYVPMAVNQESLGYFIGSTTPDQTIYQFWIQTTVGGSPLALKIYYSGAWVDVYAATLASYQTVAAMSAYYTSAQTDAAIAAAIGSGTAYAARGQLTVAQTVTTDATPVVVQLNTAPINPAPAPFDTGTYEYEAPADGIYAFNVTMQIDNDDADATSVEAQADVYLNGSSTGLGDLDGTPSPNGDRWTPSFGGMVEMNSGDTLDLRLSVGAASAATNVTINNANLSVWRVQA